MELLIAVCILSAILLLLGSLFYFLWPIIILFILFSFIMGIIRSHKKQSVHQTFQETTKQRNQNDDVIDVEFTEEQCDD